MRVRYIIARLSMLVRFGIVSTVLNENDRGCSYLRCTFVNGKILEVYEDASSLITRQSITLTDAENNILCLWQGWHPSTSKFDYKYAISAFGTYSRYLKVLLK